eukprot:CAMPEP_0194199892 /NCGR_PEP_ID=MMETSP0156-20130528/737_1 /TAXON_ID=33649 /ORGANISM="Thalassionema nitzschioides, Strain L26-B" /LENGTH=60 /DNA_ID=CAMNT_0038924839 /DNA_START=51 /DNA_END=233 /DNA_ORIENTATION=+
MAVAETFILVLFFPIPLLVNFLYGTDGGEELTKRDKCKKVAAEDISTDERRKRRKATMQS